MELPRAFFPGVAEDLPVPHIAIDDFDQSLPNVSFEPAEPAEHTRVVIASPSMRVTGAPPL